MNDRILTLHPTGKTGVNIERAKYDVIRKAIVDSIRERDEIAFGELSSAVAERIPTDFDGSISWYVTTVKLDLEARGIIERIPNRTPQTLRLVSSTAQP